MLPSKSTQAGEIIQNTTGYYVHCYYKYLDEYKLRPLTIDEMVNGLLYLKAKNMIKELYSE